MSLYQDISERWAPFLMVFFFIVLISYAVLYSLDIIPEPVSGETEEEEVSNDETKEVIEEEKSELPHTGLNNADPHPVSITFDSLGKTLTVLNPTSRKIADLDNALLSGVVRHPDSADFKNTGNIFILGHSSYLPNVFNKNFQAFNGIQELTWGDTIRLRSTDTEYIYQVERVYKAKASEVAVPVGSGKAKLTLATCNSFGSKEDRFIVEASLISKKAL